MSLKKCFLAALSALVLSTIPVVHASPLGIMVPAYFGPSAHEYWDSLDAAASRIPLVVIVNPDSGPGKSKDTAYIRPLSKLHRAGGKAIGYVHTSYGERPLAEVKKEVDLYLSFYSVDGFFIDEMSNDENTNHLNYYAALYQYIKGRGSRYTVTGNPGSSTQEDYLATPTVDTLMVFEDNGTNYSGYAMADWVARHPARQFVHLPYGVATANTMTNYVNLAVSRNAGWIYITDDTLPNPYDTLPSYWTNEVGLVRSLNGSALRANN